MARKSPGHVRAALRHRLKPGVRTAVVDGVSARGLSRIAELERTLRPGAAAAALKAWQAFAYASEADRADMIFDGQVGCCPDPWDDRRVLQRVLGVLPSKDAQSLRQRIDVLDDRIRIE
ncbi:MAG TPA: hypothetical protein VN408_07450 [Actinoplanes sp.]|nr:hypothetical protein [Actinoplanes sp.]